KVSLPSTLDDAPGAIAAWVDSEAMKALVRSFGAEAPAGSLADRLAWLDRFSERCDFRKGAERDQFSHPALTADQGRVANQAARALGLTEDFTDVRGDFDHVLVLGGLLRGCLNRARAAASFTAGGAVTARSVTALSGFRPLSGADGRPVTNPPSEVELAEAAGLSAVTTEFDAMDAALRRFFGVEEIEHEDGVASPRHDRAWRLRRYATPRPPTVQLLAAPSSSPEHRANTADGYRWFAEHVGDTQAGDRLL